MMRSLLRYVDRRRLIREYGLWSMSLLLAFVLDGVVSRRVKLWCSQFIIYVFWNQVLGASSMRGLLQSLSFCIIIDFNFCFILSENM